MLDRFGDHVEHHLHMPGEQVGFCAAVAGIADVDRRGACLPNLSGVKVARPDQ
jgi:hypothetical protein